MESQSRAVALFDFDGTLIKGDSIVAYLRLARRLKAMKRRELCRALAAAARCRLGRLTEAQAKTIALAFRQRLDPARRDALDRAFAQEILLPRVYPDGLYCLRDHREAGRLAVLVSASTENYMRFVARGLGVDALLCTALDENGRVICNCKGEEKVRRIRAWADEQDFAIDLSDSFAYGDSLSDLPMLRLCAHPTLVNPSRALKKSLPQADTVYWK